MTTTTTKAPTEVGDVLGFAISTRTMPETMARIGEFLEGSEARMVVTADSSGLVLAQDNAELAQIYRDADLATADSNGVVWALNRKGHAATRVSGVDLVSEICRLSAEKGYRIFFLGSSPGVADQAAERLRLLYPGCNIVGSRHGFFPPDDDDLVANEIAPVEPDVLFVAMGIPRQEIFISKTMGIIRAKVAMGVGGSLDVFSGRVKRAPKIIQALKLEWLWRVILNPSKFSKVKLLPKFVGLVWRYRG